MAPTYLFGIDLGTSSTKAALYTPDGRLVAESSAEVPLYTPRPGVVEQEHEDFYRTAAQTCRACVQESGVDPRHIAALAFDSQMAGVGAINEHYQPAARFDSWLDMRCQPYIEQIDRDYGDLVTRLTGCPPTCDHGPKMVWWKEERPSTYQNIAKFVMPATYVAGRMAGLRPEDAFIDYTFLHFTTLSDAQQGTWSGELCAALGIDPDKLPRIVEPWAVVGEVTETAASDFGLAPGTLIAAGCGDTAANALGAGIVQPGMLFDVAGTASVLAASTDTFMADVENRALLTMRSVIPGLWNPLAYIGGGGQALRWFRDRFFNTLHGSEQPRTADLYAELIDLAQQAPPGADGLFFSPHLGGRICPAAPDMRGAWIGFSWSHTQAHFARAVLESIAYEYAYYLQILQRAIPNLALHETRAIGGGARSTAWNQMKANVLGVPYQRLGRSEFGSWGSAMIAGKAAGIFDDLAEVAMRHAQPAGAALAPDPAIQAQYAPLVAKHIALQATLNETFLQTLHD
ncbi:MAG: FGGY family carbohydrate kinase [Chloroflexota bacterium]